MNPVRSDRQSLAVQLEVDEDLGDFGGYSGSAVLDSLGRAVLALPGRPGPDDPCLRHPARSAGLKSGCRSRLSRSISSIFQSRFQRFNCFSRAMASNIMRRVSSAKAFEIFSIWARSMFPRSSYRSSRLPRQERSRHPLIPRKKLQPMVSMFI